MLRRLGWSLVWGLGAYAVGVVAGRLLVVMFSGNTHDQEVEAVMTAFFFVGPIVGVVGAVVGLFWSRRPKPLQKSS